MLTHATHVNGWVPAVYTGCIESKLAFVSRIELIRSKLLNFSLMYPGLLTECRTLHAGSPAPPNGRPTATVPCWPLRNIRLIIYDHICESKNRSRGRDSSGTRVSAAPDDAASDVTNGAGSRRALALVIGSGNGLPVVVVVTASSLQLF